MKKLLSMILMFSLMSCSTPNITTNDGSTSTTEDSKYYSVHVQLDTKFQHFDLKSYSIDNNGVATCYELYTDKLLVFSSGTYFIQSLGRCKLCE